MIDILRGLGGIAGLIIIAWAFSRNRKAINWTQVALALLMQVLLAVAILYGPFVSVIIEGAGNIFIKILAFTGEGSAFLLGDLVDLTKTPYIFMFQVLPVTIFFAALTSVLYYYGIVQKVVSWVAFVLRKVLFISGAEGLVAAGNIFLGQTEAPLLTKKYLPTMTLSEMFLVMTAGMATIAGGVMAAYISMLGGNDPAAQSLFAKHLISASVMAAPGAILMSKIFFPQTEKVEAEVKVANDSVGSNFFDALSNGTAEGIRLAVNIAGMLLVIIALVAMINFVLGDMIGDWTGLNALVHEWSGGNFDKFSIEYVLSLVFTPLAWIMGVPTADASLAASLLGKKMALNEFVAYGDLNVLKNAGAFAYDKSIIMTTYFLCGFANLSSVGILIGGLGSLAPDKKLFITQYGMLAMIAATLASCLSATIVGAMI